MSQLEEKLSKPEPKTNREIKASSNGHALENGKLKEDLIKKVGKILAEFNYDLILFTASPEQRLLRAGFRNGKRGQIQAYVPAKEKERDQSLESTTDILDISDRQHPLGALDLLVRNDIKEIDDDKSVTFGFWENTIPVDNVLHAIGKKFPVVLLKITDANEDAVKPITNIITTLPQLHLERNFFVATNPDELKAHLSKLQ